MTDLDLEPALDRVADWEARQGYLKFLHHVVVNSQPIKLPFRLIGEAWQHEREERRAGALDHLAGLNLDYSGKRRFYSGCAKGNDKSTGVARRLLYLLAYSRTPLQLYICSGKEEQGAIITAAMKMELASNPWLASLVDVSDYTGRGASGSELTVMPMKAATGQGIFPDYLVADELTHWEHEGGRKFWNFIMGTIRKRPSCMFEVLTNAGHIGSWQWSVRNEIQKMPEYWDFFEQPANSTLASWMDEGAIERDGKLMDPGEKRRLLLNEWIDPGEERGYLTLAEALLCVDPFLKEESCGIPGNEYFVVLDYGGVNDRTALGVLHSMPGTDSIVVDRLDCWQGTRTDPVQIDIDDDSPSSRSVEDWLEVTFHKHHFGRNCTIVLDPTQLEGLAQKYERKGHRVLRFEYMGGKNNYRMAQLLKSQIQNKKISWSPNAGLLLGAEDDTLAKELARLIKKPMSYGYRFDHESGRHDDRAVVLGMGLVYMIPEIMPGGARGPERVKPKEPDENAPVIGLPYGPSQNWAKGRNLFGMGNR